jgi:hypothetical protein
MALSYILNTLIREAAVLQGAPGSNNLIKSAEPVNVLHGRAVESKGANQTTWSAAFTRGHTNKQLKVKMRTILAFTQNPQVHQNINHNPDTG